MIRLSTVIETFEVDFLKQYRCQIRPEHTRALTAMTHCRTQSSLKMQVQCSACEHQKLVPQSCGHRHCPHCQHHESQQWLERQMKKQVPAEYFLLTFTVPAEFRALVFAHQRIAYVNPSAVTSRRSSTSGVIFTAASFVKRTSSPARTVW